MGLWGAYIMEGLPIKPIFSITKLGVGLLELITTSPQQLDWLNPTPDDTRLMSVLDKMNQRYGRDTLFLTAQDIDQK